MSGVGRSNKWEERRKEKKKKEKKKRGKGKNKWEKRQALASAASFFPTSATYITCA